MKEEKRFNNRSFLREIKEVRETRDANELAELLSTGKWIAVLAVKDKCNGYLFSMGRVD